MNVIILANKQAVITALNHTSEVSINRRKKYKKKIGKNYVWIMRSAMKCWSSGGSVAVNRRLFFYCTLQLSILLVWDFCDDVERMQMVTMSQCDGCIAEWMTAAAAVHCRNNTEMSSTSPSNQRGRSASAATDLDLSMWGVNVERVYSVHLSTISVIELGIESRFDISNLDGRMTWPIYRRKHSNTERTTFGCNLIGLNSSDTQPKRQYEMNRRRKKGMHWFD